MGDIPYGESNFFSLKQVFVHIPNSWGGRGNCKLDPVLTNKTSLTKLVA